MRPPTVALWGTGGPAAAHAAACRSLGWNIPFVVLDASLTGAGDEPTDELAQELGAVTLTAEQLGASRRADIVVLTRRAPVSEIGFVLDAGHHLVIAPPLADTLGDADAIVAFARAARAQGRRVLYGDAFCAAPVVEELFAQLTSMSGDVSHVSSKVVQPPPRGPVVPHSPLHHHGVHGIAATLLAARLTGRGHPIGVAGARRISTGPVTEVAMHFATGDPIRVHASFGPPSGPAWDLQVASASEVLRVDLLPVPTLERNGTPLTRSTQARSDPAVSFGFLPQLQRFWSDIDADRSPMLPAEFGRDVLEIVCAAHASADGNLIELPFAGPRELSPEELEAAT